MPPYKLNSCGFSSIQIHISWLEQNLLAAGFAHLGPVSIHLGFNVFIPVCHIQDGFWLLENDTRAIGCLRLAFLAVIIAPALEN